MVDFEVLKKPRRTKEKRDKLPPESQSVEPELVTKEKRSKKRKREKAIVEIEPELEPVTKKKRKNKTGLSDPSEDSALSEQAQKALSYAFTLFRHPKRWKFHKARQNWLIRNIWSAENIPDTHIPLVLKYVANIQGGVRANLVNACETHLATKEVSADNPPVTEKSTKADVPDATTVPDVKTLRMLSVLEVLKASPPSPS